MRIFSSACHRFRGRNIVVLGDMMQVYLARSGKAAIRMHTRCLPDGTDLRPILPSLYGRDFRVRKKVWGGDGKTTLNRKKVIVTEPPASPMTDNWLEK